jgi:hypothetical protein
VDPPGVPRNAGHFPRHEWLNQAGWHGDRFVNGEQDLQLDDGGTSAGNDCFKMGNAAQAGAPVRGPPGPVWPPIDSSAKSLRSLVFGLRDPPPLDTIRGPGNSAGEQGKIE